MATARCVLAEGAVLSLPVSPQFLSLDDLPDSRASVDLRNDQALSVSAPPLRVGAAPTWGGCWSVSPCAPP